MESKSEKAINKITNGPVASWKGLYKAGGISAIFHVIIALIVPFFYTLITRN